MSEPLAWPKTWQEAIPLVVWTVLVLGCGLEFIAGLVHGQLWPTIFSFAGMVGLLAMLIHGKALFERFAVLDARWLVTTVLVILLGIALSPFIEEQRWPFSTVFHDPATPEQIAEAVKQLPSQPPITVHDSATPEQIAQAAAPQIREAQNREAAANTRTETVVKNLSAALVDVERFKRQAETAQQSEITARTQADTFRIEREEANRQRDAAIRQYNETKNPSLQSPPNSLDEMEAWRSVDKELSGLGTALTKGNIFLSSWRDVLKNNRSQLPVLPELFTRSINQIKQNLSILRGSYLNYPEISEALKESVYVRSNDPVTKFDKLLNSIQYFYIKASEIQQRGPAADDESSLESLERPIRRDLNALSDWQFSNQQLAIRKSK